MEGSYVRGLAIHETFNRAINVHGTHNMLVEHTVIHNVMGGALFLEDGIEQGNRYYVCTASTCIYWISKSRAMSNLSIEISANNGSFPLQFLLEVVSIFLSCSTKLIKHFDQQDIFHNGCPTAEPITSGMDFTIAASICSVCFERFLGLFYGGMLYWFCSITWRCLSKPALVC